PDLMCLLLPSLPATSTAWKISRNEWLSLAQSSFWASASASTNSCSRLRAKALRSSVAKPAKASPPFQPVSRPARFALLPGWTMSLSTISSAMVMLPILQSMAGGHHQHGRGTSMDDVGGDASQREPTEAAVAVGADDDNC